MQVFLSTLFVGSIRKLVVVACVYLEGEVKTPVSEG